VATLAGQPYQHPDDWSRIAERHYESVYRLAYRLTGNRVDAEDLTQDTFVRVFRSLDSFRPAGSFEGWLHRITTNLFFDAKRRQARIRMEDLDDADTSVAPPAAEPDRLVEVSAANAALARTLSGLSPDLLQALVMCDVEGLSYQEIADRLGVALGTVRSRLHRARAQARLAISQRS
jgi:RNA polymerase sigma-70 factor (ECF subfamily)